MQLGFVIDHSRCIGCHACTVACKAENDVPLGKFRTWVKYTEAGTFPEVRRSFAVLRCNQCTDAPCVTICPVRALDKRADGIVDVDPAACIGCKACMQACPYDALYINDSTGTAQKCHFCAHRTERGLAPACAVVCPTEAIIPGDFHDPDSVVSRLRAEQPLEVRKAEAGTGPNVYYREVGEAGIDPALTSSAGGFLWANQLQGVQLEAERFEAEAKLKARTTYDVEHPPLWGGRVSLYLFTKSLAAGLFPLVALAPETATLRASLAALVFLALTGWLLISDLKRPARFLFILTRPNWSSWLTRGTVVLTAFGAVLVLCSVLGATGRAATALPLTAGATLAALTAAYTGWLFGQSKGRVLWMRRGLWLHLIVQAAVAGGAAGLLMPYTLGVAEASGPLRFGLAGALVLHAVFIASEGRMAPARRAAEYARALRLVTHGPFARRHRLLGIGAGIAVPLVLLLVPGAPLLWAAAAGLALVGLFVEEDILVRAGQALRIS